MNRRTALVPALLAAAAATASCGTTARPVGAASSAPPPSLATSLVTATGTWAVAVTGGPAAGHNNFWQLLVRPAASSTWRLATPPGVASNGGLVIASPGTGTLVAGFRPSQDLAYSPLATTHDNGAAWSPSLLDARLADNPGALAATGTGHLLALLTDGTAELSTTGGTRWAPLATLRSLASSAAGRRCGLENLSAAAFSPSGTPLLAGTCSHRGTAGVFAYTRGTWHRVGPTPPATLPGQPTRVLSLTTAGNRQTALLAAGTGRDTTLVAAWSLGSGRWALSPSLPLGGSQVASVSIGPGGGAGIVLNGRAGITLARPGSSWRWLPFLPAGTQTLAPGPGPQVHALAAAGTTFTDWAWAPGSAAWAKVQTLHVPVQYGSSG